MLVTACDAVLPACEDDATLAWLAERLPAWGVPLLFDLEAYRVTSSKLRSNGLFAELDVPRPRPWPDCGFPAVVKPSAASGSEGVRVAATEAQVAEARDALRPPATSGRRGVRRRAVALARGASPGAGAAGAAVTGLEFDAATTASASRHPWRPPQDCWRASRSPASAWRKA